MASMSPIAFNIQTAIFLNFQTFFEVDNFNIYGTFRVTAPAHHIAISKLKLSY